MSGFMVTYDLPSGNYQGMDAAIQLTGPCCRIATTTWLAKGDFSAEALLAHLAQQCGPADRIAIMDSQGKVVWHGLPLPIVNWIRSSW